MRQIIKSSLWVLLLASGLQSSRAFSPAGPIGNGGDAWQTAVIGYGLSGDINAPKNIGEEYRRNTPVMYWTYDANFAGYYGSNGIVAIRNAYSVLNALTNVDHYSKSLSEIPLESRHQNYTAQTLGLLDLKSTVLYLMVEQLGLCDPVRYDWSLHGRVLPAGGTCPLDMEYMVVPRNLDITSTPLNQLQYSPYVNNILYSYNIVENCRPPNPVAYASPFSVDPLADIYSPVASLAVIFWGDYYTGLTRDDVAGLRYLFTTNNIIWETPAPGALLLTTNLGAVAPQLTTSNLNALLVFSQTNPPSLVPGTFPNVVVTATVTNWVYVTNWSIGSYLSTPYGSPVGTQILTVYSNIVGTAWQPVYQDTFANVITNGNLAHYPGLVFAGNNVVLNYSPNTVATLQTVQATVPNGAPLGTIITNTTYQTIVISNMPSGEYLSIPSSQCGWRILDYPPSWSVVAITNLIAQATNTYLTSSTTSNTFVGSQSIVYYFTNHTYLVQPIICNSSAPSNGLYAGIGQVQFVEADYDSLLGQFFQPVTNDYTMTLVVNGQTVVQKMQRVVTAPDFLLSASDQASGVSENLATRNLTFDQANILAGLAGPGTITSPTTITLNKVGPNYYNEGDDVTNGTPYFTELPGTDTGDLFYSGMPYFVWASYDGTTNAPVVYPDGTSILNLENQILIHFLPTTLPGGFSDVPYGPVTIAANGGAFTQPYTWSVSGLPPGLTLVSNSDSTATLSGTPTQSGTFDFTLTMTDYVGRSVQRNRTITIQ